MTSRGDTGQQVTGLDTDTILWLSGTTGVEQGCMCVSSPTVGIILALMGRLSWQHLVLSFCNDMEKTYV